jgi:uncharacterized protein (DUF302 family)
MGVAMTRWIAMMLVVALTACSHAPSRITEPELIGKISPGMPPIDPNNAIYELAVNEGVSHQDVIDSLKSLSEGKNFVNPANFPIGEHMKLRGQDPGGVLEVRAFCNLGLGAEIMLDHPEFIVFAPCRIALYEKPDSDGKKRLYLGLDRPTYDLKNIRQPTERAKKAAQELETTLLEIMDKARKGDL